MSTFDTDPFEPQPEGVNTIFPFWVPQKSEADSINHQPSTINNSHPLNSQHSTIKDSPRSGYAEAHSINHQPSTINHLRSGYIELPYTLPQDSTLFLLLRETTIDIWKQFDWIAGNRGMTLLNVHPDYIRLGDTPAGKHSYPVRFFTQLLHYVTGNYGDSVWNALLSDVAAFVAARQSRGMPDPDGAPFLAGNLCRGTNDSGSRSRNSQAQDAFTKI